MLRSNLLFIHVISAMGIFLALGIEGIALAQLRRATDGAAVRAALVSFSAVQRVAGPSMLLLLISGLYLAKAYWQWKGAWMGLGFLGLVAVGAIGGVLTGRNMRRLRKALETGGEIAAAGIAHGIFRMSYALRLVLLALVVYLMTVKPG
jgi:uncharacterized membrane protein